MSIVAASIRFAPALSVGHFPLNQVVRSFLLLVLLVPALGAQALPEPEVFQLLRLVFPDLTQKDGLNVATRSVPVRNDFRDDAPAAGEGEFTVQAVDLRPFSVAGKPYFAFLLTTTGADELGEPLLLAVFDRETPSSPKVVDVVEVRADRSCWLEPGDVLGIACSHHNSQQEYTYYRFVTVSRGRAVPIAEIPLLNQQGVCGASFEQTLAVRSTQASRIVAFRVKAVIRPDEPGLGCRKPLTRQSIRYFTATYVRDPITGRYQTLSKELESLANWNQRNY